MDWQQVFSADSFNQYVVPWAINIVFALGIFIVGRWVVSGLIGVLRRLLIKARMDDILVDFICTIARAALLLFVIIAALDQFGVYTTSLIALLGAAGLAGGLAM